MNKKLYVGNLSYATTEADLRVLFAKFGPVTSVTLITDRQTGQSKGFGFVEMGTAQAAQKAIERLNKSKFNERTLTVNEARPRESSPAAGRRFGARSESRESFSQGRSYRDGGRRLY